MQTILPFHHQPSYVAEDFLISSANMDAHSWITSDTELWHNGTLLIWGETGSGKTHLAHIWASQHNAPFLSSEQIARPSDIYQTKTPPFWVIDNIDIQLHRNIDETTLFHLLNIITQENGRMLLTASTPPTTWNIQLKDLASRLRAISTVKLHLPDTILMKALLIKLFSDRQLHIHEDVVEYIITRIDRNFKAIHTIVSLLDHASMRQKRNITTPLVREIISNDASLNF